MMHAESLDFCDCCDVRRRALALAAAQAEDEGLWFEAVTAPEEYLQQALRELHTTIEDR